MFSFNSPQGACNTCSGLGTTEEFDPALIVPDESLSIERGAIAPWTGKSVPRYYHQLSAALVEHFQIDPDTPWRELPARARKGIVLGLGEIYEDRFIPELLELLLSLQLSLLFVFILLPRFPFLPLP